MTSLKFQTDDLVFFLDDAELLALAYPPILISSSLMYIWLYLSPTLLPFVFVSLFMLVGPFLFLERSLARILAKKSSTPALLIGLLSKSHRYSISSLAQRKPRLPTWAVVVLSKKTALPADIEAIVRSRLKTKFTL